MKNFECVHCRIWGTINSHKWTGDVSGDKDKQSQFIMANLLQTIAELAHAKVFNFPSLHRELDWHLAQEANRLENGKRNRFQDIKSNARS